MKIQIGCLVSLALLAVCGCATLNEPKTPDVAIDDFMREYLGVQFGDDITKINGSEDGQYEIPMLNDFQYFNRVAGCYQKGKLVRINMCVDVDKKYSQTSTETQLKETLAALTLKLCLPKTYFDCQNGYYSCPKWGDPVRCVKETGKPCGNVKLSYKVKYAYVELPNYRRYLIDIVDTKLDASLKSPKTKAPAYKPVTEEMRRNWGIPLPDAK